MRRARAAELVLALALVATPAAADVAGLADGAPACDPGRPTCLGLAVHVAVGADGAPVATGAWLRGQLAAANRLHAPTGVGFQIVSVDALPASAARVANRRQRDALAPRVTGTHLHVFVTARLDDVDADGAEIRGVTWRRDADTKFVILSTIARDVVLAHELGHVFGLPHSTHPRSIMNKTPRERPPLEERTFVEAEIRTMRARVQALLRARRLAGVPRS